MEEWLMVKIFVYSWISCILAYQKELVLCKGETKEILCSEGEIKIINASYGRHNSTTCPGPEMINTNCHAPESFNYVNRTCGGNSSCTIKAENKKFDKDPCGGIYKYFLIEYNCKNQGGNLSEHTVIVCEKNKHNINCSNGEIQVTNASYGRQDNYTCPYKRQTEINCHASNSKSVVEEECDGKRNCTLYVDDLPFSGGDGCKNNTHRYLSVYYNCTKPGCFCPCTSDDEKISFEAEFKQMINELNVDKKSTSKMKRSLISAKDDRPTSRAIGGVAIGFIIAVFSLIIIPDVCRFFMFLRKFYQSRNRRAP